MTNIQPYAARKAGYRSDIDGLRAIAVLGVLLFHIRSSLMPGGYLGVDVFFVISGYLITGIIERGRERGTFSFADFYERRIRRIIPALYVMMAVTIIPAALKMWPVEFESFGKSLKYVAISMGNFEFLDSVEDYFNEGSDLVPLLHTWSLAVEEQFYFLFPILLLGLGRFVKSGKARIGILGGMLIVSLAGCLWRGAEAPMSAFFLLPYRAWELLAGAMLAILMPSLPKALKSGGTAEVLGWAGVALIGAAFWIFEGNESIHGVPGIFACVGAVLLILSGEGGMTTVAKILSNRLLVGIGVISYSLYLWHWPVIVFSGEVGGMDLATGVVVFVLSLVLGWASWRWIERPFRAQKPGQRTGVFVVWAVLTLGFVLGSNYIRKNDGFPGRFDEEVVHFLKYAEKVGGVRTKDHYDVEKAPVFGSAGAGEQKVAVWGDSHAEALVPGIEAAAIESGAIFRTYLLDGQPPVSGVSQVQNRVADRAAYNERVFQALLKNNEIETVILAARWSNPIHGRNEEKGALSVDFYQKDFQDEEQKRRYYVSRIEETVRKLVASGKRVFVVDPIPELGTHVPNFLARLAFEKKPLPATLACPDYMRRNALVMGVFERLEKEGAVIRIRPQEQLMDGDEVRILEDGVPLYRDDDHLSVDGAVSLKDLFLPAFDRK